MQGKLRYTFEYKDACNMCGSPIDGHRILGKRMNKSQGRKPRNRIGITTTVMQCRNCKLIYSNPQPVPYDLQDHYGIPPEEYWVEEYFQVQPDYFKPVIKRLSDLMEISKGKKALDIGAGLGKAMIALDSAGFDTYGFEPSVPFFERAISKMGISKDRLKQGAMEEMNYDPGQFDFITFGAVLEHLYDPSECIRKALTWLKKDGVIHIEVPSSDWLINRLINSYYMLTSSDYVGNISPMHEPFHLYEFGLRSFELHGLQNNYKVAFSEYFVGLTYMPKLLDLILKPYMKFTNTGMQLSIYLKKH